MHRALLFLNGQPPNLLPKVVSHYDIIVCTDGAYSYLVTCPIEIDYIIGDLDSIEQKPKQGKPFIISTPDQNKTDFEKALLFLINKGISAIDIYGATGYATDHFLGNLSVALHYHQQIFMQFYDDFSRFFFANHTTRLHDVKGKIISILPFPLATAVCLQGFVYPLDNATLKLGDQTSLRNKAAKSEVSITYKRGDLLVFIERQ